jgi:hypothetical protein
MMMYQPCSSLDHETRCELFGVREIDGWPFDGAAFADLMSMGTGKPARFGAG